MRAWYGESFYSNRLPEFAVSYLKKLPEDVTCLISIGNSGCAIASAMIALASMKRLGHRAYRKGEEYAHSKGYIGAATEGKVCAIVDDFIATGETIEKLLVKSMINNKDNISCILINTFFVNEYTPSICPNFAKMIREKKLITLEPFELTDTT